MGYNGPYSLGERFAAELLGMFCTIFIALSGIANHSLKRTAGNGMGYGFLAFAFGMGFSFSFIAFGAVSAVLNPAAALANVILGYLDAGDFFALIMAEYIGAFIAAVAVWALYLPQFQRLRPSLPFLPIDRKDFHYDTEEQKTAAVRDRSAFASDMDQEDLHTAAPDMLGVFVTRPAVNNPVLNFLSEFLGSFVFLFMALLITNRGNYIYQPSLGLYTNIIGPFFVGLLISVMIMTMGGPAGFAGNPARDLGPRIAHQLLPIPGKKSSEWSYGWIPFFAPFCAAAVAAWIFKPFLNIFQGQVNPNSNPFGGSTNVAGQTNVTTTP